MNEETGKLGLNIDSLSQKMLDYSTFYLNQIKNNEMDNKKLSDFVNDHFTTKEITYLAVSFLSEKTNELSQKR